MLCIYHLRIHIILHFSNEIESAFKESGLFLKEMLDVFGMKEKAKLFWVSAAEARRFVEKVTGMYNEIKERKNARKEN